MRHVSRGEAESSEEKSGDRNEGHKHRSVLRVDDACAEGVLFLNNPALFARTASSSRNINSSRKKGSTYLIHICKSPQREVSAIQMGTSTWGIRRNGV